MTQLNISDSSIKLLQENIGINLHGLASGNEFLDITTKATKVKIYMYISIHSGILFSCKKKWSTDTLYNVDILRKHFAKLNS